MSTPKPTVLYIGASRGIGYAAYTSLTQSRRDLHHILLLRSISSFKSRIEFTKLSEDVVARTTFVEGDAFNDGDVSRVLGMEEYDVQDIIYSVGPPDPTSIVQTLIHGVQFEPKDYGARGMFSILRAVAPLPKPPKLVFVTAVGMGIKGRARLPFPLRIMFNYFLTAAHDDKIAGELAVLKALQLPSSLPLDFPSTSELKLAQSTYDSIPSSFLPPSNVLIVRPTVLTSAPAQGWGSYRAVQDGSKEHLEGKTMWTISREDVGGFIAAVVDEAGPEGAGRWWGHQVVVGY